MNRVVGDFKAVATGDQTIRLKDLRGKHVVIYISTPRTAPRVVRRRAVISAPCMPNSSVPEP